VPEILRHGHSGWICETEEETAGAVGRTAVLDRAACRREFEQRFTGAAMARRYLQVYERIAARASSPAAARRPTPPGGPRPREEGPFHAPRDAPR
jgi:hypothetical protein